MLIRLKRLNKGFKQEDLFKVKVIKILFRIILKLILILYLIICLKIDKIKKLRLIIIFNQIKIYAKFNFWNRILKFIVL